MSHHPSPLVIERHGRVAVVTLNRPEALNALNQAVLDAFCREVVALDRDDGIGCIVVTGHPRAFAAGADIKEMLPMGAQAMREQDHFGPWQAFAQMRTPRIAAVAGYALGGGCELAMMCDFIYAAEDARFGQPEITLGVIPGIGGTQRLARLVGKAKAAELVLTGRLIEAREALQCGLVARVLPADVLLRETLVVARQIAQWSRPALRLAKECLDRSWESPLQEGLLFERRNFHALFATQDQKEGMAAFVEKRAPQFRHC